MKQDTQRRIRNLLHLIKKHVSIEPDGNWNYTRWETRAKPVSTGGFTLYYFEGIPHSTWGKVRMPC